MTKTFVYIIANGEAAVKVGKSRDPQDRLKELQVGSHSLLSLEYTVQYDDRTASKIERATHGLLQHCRITREWFSTSVEYAKKAILEAERLVISDASELGQRAKRENCTPRKLQRVTVSLPLEELEGLKKLSRQQGLSIDIWTLMLMRREAKLASSINCPVYVLASSKNLKPLNLP